MTLKNDENTFFKCHDAVTVSSACERLRHGGLWRRSERSHREIVYIYKE